MAAIFEDNLKLFVQVNPRPRAPFTLRGPAKIGHIVRSPTTHAKSTCDFALQNIIRHIGFIQT